MKKSFVVCCVCLAAACALAFSACCLAEETWSGQGVPDVGSTVVFGRYEQDNYTDNGPEPIEWTVLDVQDGKALLLSKYGLDAEWYNTMFENVTWETCTLRSWLNQDFLQEAFSVEEQAAIQLTDVDNSQAQGFDWTSVLSYVTEKTVGGNNTRDKIFLLSCAEAYRYLGVSYEDRNNMKSRVALTDYADAKGAIDDDDYKTTEGRDAAYWWLRSPGDDQRNAAGVASGGWLFTPGLGDTRLCVRPAMWIDLTAADLNGPQADEPDDYTAEWSAAYEHLVMDGAYRQSGLTFYENVFFLLFDLNKDGIPELFIHNGGEDSSTATAYVWTWKPDQGPAYAGEVFQGNPFPDETVFVIEEGVGYGLYEYVHYEWAESDYYDLYNMARNRISRRHVYDISEAVETRWYTPELIRQMGWDDFVHAPCARELLELEDTEVPETYTSGVPVNVYFRIAGGDPPYEISWVLAEENGDGEVLDKGEEKTEDARYSFSFTPDYQGDAIHLYLYARDRYDRHTYTVGIWEYVLSEDPNGAKPAAPVGNYPNWQAAYRDFLLNGGYRTSEDEFCFYDVFGNSFDEEEIDLGLALYDMNRDGIPELFAESGFYDTAMSWVYVYTYADDGMKYAGMIPNTGTGLRQIPDDRYPGVIAYSGRMGAYPTIYYFLKNDGTLQEEIIREEYDFDPDSEDYEPLDEPVIRYYTKDEILIGYAINLDETTTHLPWYGRPEDLVEAFEGNAAGSATQAGPTEPQILFYAKTSKATNVRSEADKTSALLTKIGKKGVTVEVLETLTGADGKEWYRIRLEDGTVGYARYDFFKKTDKPGK